MIFKMVIWIDQAKYAIVEKNIYLDVIKS